MRAPTKLLRCKWPPNDGVMPGNERFDAIFSSVQKEGIREPITINLKWSVIDGNHRLAAARRLSIESVEVRVWTGMEFVSAPAVPEGYALVPMEFSESRFGVFRSDGRFEELGKDWTSDPDANTARWVGGTHDMQTIRAAMLAARKDAP